MTLAEMMFARRFVIAVRMQSRLCRRCLYRCLLNLERHRCSMVAGYAASATASQVMRACWINLCNRLRIIASIHES